MPTPTQTATPHTTGPLAVIPHTDLTQLDSHANGTKNGFHPDRKICNNCYIFCAVSQDYKLLLQRRALITITDKQQSNYSTKDLCYINILLILDN